MESTSSEHGVQLQPETIFCAVAETEEKFWNQGGISEELEESLQSDDGELGNLILQHGKMTKRTHSYFTNLEQRKCCLLLASCKQTFRSVRLVRSDGRDSGIEEGAMMKPSKGNTETVSCLSAEDFQVFQHALRCAAFPVLGAPDPPSGSSPSPRATPAAGLMQKRSDIQDSMILARTVTPHSAGDSGVEEQDDAMVPAETLCEQLRRAFQLTTEKFNQYEDIIATQLEKKTPQKILVEELVRQLMALENNSNTFYNPTTFLNRLGYDRWQQRERIHITELIQKFWHFSLPQLTQSSGRSSQPKHEQYVRLMEKLLAFEFPFRRENEHDVTSAPPTTPLSSASLRLLKEFGLRYGVGDQYRKIVYLHYLATNFEPTLWFIQHVSTSLTSVMEGMPSKRSFLTIVKEEYVLLEKSLHLLDVKTSAALGKMKTLFPGNQPADGIESLIELLSITLQSKAYLLMQTEERLADKLQKIIQSIFPTTYERHKLVAKDELRQNKWEVELNPRLLNMLIGHIRDEVTDYKMNYQQTFNRYFNITLEAAQEFYKLLMSDIEELHRQKQDEMNNMEIDLLMLSLVYRLNQLDKDWNSYITPIMQTWRTILLQEAQHWTIVMKVHMQDFVTQAVGHDMYENAKLKWIGSLHQSSSHGSSQRYHSGSVVSLTPSINSAFSTLSSPHSTPVSKQMATIVSHPPVIQESNEGSVTPKQSSKENPAVTLFENSILTLSSNLHGDRRPYSDPVNVSHSSVLKGSYIGDMARSLGHYDHDHFLSFAHLRRSSSLPNMKNINAEKQEKSDKVDFVTGALDKDAKNILNIGEESETEVEIIPTSPEVVDSRVLQGGEESQEIQNFMDNPLTVTTELEESDDSHTLTDDSGSQDGEFTFPPIQEVDSVSTSPVHVVHHEPVTVSDTLTKISAGIFRPTPESSKQESSTRKSLNVINHMRKPKDVSYEEEKVVPSGSESRQCHNSSSFSTSEGTSAETNTNLKQTIPDSHVSIISFPSQQQNSAALLPLSSSAVDMIVIFQRLVGIGKTLCQTFSPVRKIQCSEPSFPSPSSSDEAPHFQPQSYNSRQKLYDGFLNCLCSTVSLYADNMLCMDLCGTSSSVASKLAGPRLVEYLQTQQRSGLIWGCRHNRKGTKSCFDYLDKKTNLLCDRHEPVTREMCTRINNVMAILTFLELYHRRLGKVFGMYGDWSVKKKQNLNASVNSLDTLRSDFIVVDSYGYDPSGDRMDVFETASQRFPDAEVNSGSQPSMLVSSPIDSYKSHLMAILRAQSRIMAYRLNLFVCDALPVLLTLKSPSVTIEKGLKPVTDFLTSYISVLRKWLYMDSFRRVLECLWIFIVQDFELELDKLEKQEDITEETGQLLLQAVAHLLKFMNSQDESLRKELLLEQADDVSFQLNLFAMPVQHLISIYKGLLKESHDTENSSVDTQYQSVIQVREHLRHDLQKLRKGFSGSDLVTWIMDNQQLFTCFDPLLSDGGMNFTQEMAFHASQRLLDWGLISDVEGESGRCHSPTESLIYEFPDLTQIHGYGYQERSLSRQSEDSTPQATPRATPRPNLRDSIRAASRHSLLRHTTPALKNIDKSTSLTSNRSVRQSKLEKGDRFDKSERTSQRKQNSESSRDVSTDDKTIAQMDNPVIEIHVHEQNRIGTHIPVIVTSEEAVVSNITGSRMSKCEVNDENLKQNIEDENIENRSLDHEGTMGGSRELTSENLEEEKKNEKEFNSRSEENIFDSSESGFVQDSLDMGKSGTSQRTDSLQNFVKLDSVNSSTDIEPALSPNVVSGNQVLPQPKQHETSYNSQTQDLDPYLMRGSPVSYSSGNSSHSVSFFGTSDHFYYVCPQVGGEMETTLKNYEQFHLVEECYQKKIRPEYILRIIYNRRRNDICARNFLSKLPYNIIQSVILEDETSSMCVSS